MNIFSYVEDLTAKELAKKIVDCANSGEKFYFKHMDSAIGFSSADNCLFAHDVDSTDNTGEFNVDPFQRVGGDFGTVILNHYGDATAFVEMLDSLASAGLELELSDWMNMDSVDIAGFKEQLASAILTNKNLREAASDNYRRSKL